MASLQQDIDRAGHAALKDHNNGRIAAWALRGGAKRRELQGCCSHSAYAPICLPLTHLAIRFQLALQGRQSLVYCTPLCALSGHTSRRTHHHCRIQVCRDGLVALHKRPAGTVMLLLLLLSESLRAGKDTTPT
jgi:hypothetical protein